MYDPDRVKSLRRPTGLPFRIGKLGHVVLNVRDVEHSARFYTEVLGFEISDAYPEEMVAGGMVLGSAISGESYGWVQDAIDVFYFLAVWLLVVTVVHLTLNKLFLPGTSLRKELLVNRNIAAGIIEAVLFISVTLFYIRVWG